MNSVSINIFSTKPNNTIGLNYIPYRVITRYPNGRLVFGPAISYDLAVKTANNYNTYYKLDSWVDEYFESPV